MLTAANMAAASGMPQAGRDVIIVLGCGLKGPAVGGLLRRRLDRALEYYHCNPQAVFAVSGGQGPDEPLPEALAMKNYLVEQGVPESKIITEDQSQNTKQNLYFTKRALDARLGGGYSAVIVTSEFHMLRSMNYAKKAGFDDVQPLASRSDPYQLPRFYLREYFALMGYYLLESWR